MKMVRTKILTASSEIYLTQSPVFFRLVKMHTFLVLVMRPQDKDERCNGLKFLVVFYGSHLVFTSCIPRMSLPYRQINVLRMKRRVSTFILFGKYTVRNKKRACMQAIMSRASFVLTFMEGKKKKRERRKKKC